MLEMNHVTHSIHGIYMYIYIPTFYHKNQPNVGKYIPYMDPFQVLQSNLWVIQYQLMVDQVGGMLGPMAARMYFHLFQQVKVGKPKGSGGQANSLLIEFRSDIFLGEDDMTYS